MKIKSYLRKSISRQFIAILCFFILLFLIGAIILVYAQEQVNNNYVETRNKLVHKSTMVSELNNHLEKAMFDARGYIAFNNQAMKKSSIDEKTTTAELISQFKEVATTGDDYFLVTELVNFHQYYFNGILQEAIHYFEEGNMEAVTKIATDGGTDRINTIKKDINDYLQSTNDLLNNKLDKLKHDMKILQFLFLTYIFILLFVIYLIERNMVKRIGKPLANFAKAANEIAKGNHAEILIERKREDELGVLSVAFAYMYTSIEEKKQDLTSQNEELIAQQNELQVQKVELERALETVKQNEETLQRRNSLIKGISNSLYKKEVLDSIIVNLSAILRADRGIILVMEDHSYASYSISEESANQFRADLYQGMLERLKKDEVPFILTRELVLAEKGYVHDLYIPVFNAEKSIIAVIMLSSFSNAFSNFDQEEFISLAKQIGISLDKIQLFEQTERDRELNRDILNTIQEGIQLISETGEIVLINEKFTSLVGMQKGPGCALDEWLKVLENQFLDPESLIQFMKASLKAKQGKSFIAFSKEGKVINIYMEELYRGTKKFGLFVYRDITKEYEVDKMKSEFVSTVSHELRTPLASILGFTELMINRELKIEKQKKYLHTIYGEAKRLTSLIDDFLDVQRMEAGKQGYEKKFMELMPIVESVKDKLKVNATKAHTIEIVNMAKEDIILGDKGKVEQAITNLLSNAIKYSPAGGRIEIKLYKEDHHLKLAFKDEGLGIPETAMDKLFSKFYRVDNSDRRSIGGTGLGLAIVQKIMHAHEGEVQVESKFGKGSIFTLIFPATNHDK